MGDYEWGRENGLWGEDGIPYSLEESSVEELAEERHIQELMEEARQEKLVEEYLQKSMEEAGEEAFAEKRYIKNDFTSKINNNIPKTVWVIAPGKEAKLWNECRDEGYITIGWDKINVNKYKTKDDLKKELISLYQEKEKTRKNTFLWNFAKVMKVGDIVIARNGRSIIIGIGEIISDYIAPDDNNNPRKNKESQQIRKVNWFDKNEYIVKKNLFPMNTVYRMESNDKNIFAILKNSWNSYKTLRSITKKTESKNNTLKKELVVKQNFSNDNTIGKLGFDYKNILLKGVPGTGKSRSIDNIIKKELKLENHYKTNVLRINIHSASSNADLMQGIAINSNSDGSIGYKEKKGLVLKFIEKATFRPKQPFVLVLEEIQENSLNELIGDLIYLIDNDKRAEELKPDNIDYSYIELIKKIISDDTNVERVEMPNLISQSSEIREMVIPENLFIFCTSNYREDRKVIEDNLLRRFDVIEIYPKSREEIGKDEDGDFIFRNEDTSDFLEELNKSIVSKCKDNGEIHPDRFMIGHSIWLKVEDKKAFSRAFLKVITEFKDVKDMHFDDFKKITDKLDFPFELEKEYESYEEWIKVLQKESYSFLSDN